MHHRLEAGSLRAIDLKAPTAWRPVWRIESRASQLCPGCGLTPRIGARPKSGIASRACRALWGLVFALGVTPVVVDSSLIRHPKICETLRSRVVCVCGLLGRHSWRNECATVLRRRARKSSGSPGLRAHFGECRGQQHCGFIRGGNSSSGRRRRCACLLGRHACRTDRGLR